MSEGNIPSIDDFLDKSNNDPSIDNIMENSELPSIENFKEKKEVIEEEIKTVVERVKKSLGNDPSKWRWGDLHKIQFKHSLNKFDDWKDLHLGPDEIGGSPTTLSMAMHMGKGPGKTEKDEIPCRVYHGPAYRLVVDLNDPEHAKFVIAGGNGGRVGSKFCLNHYTAWLKGDYYTLNFNREEINESFIWQFDN